jgi:hypothetical protein
LDKQEGVLPPLFKKTCFVFEIVSLYRFAECAWHIGHLRPEPVDHPFSWRRFCGTLKLYNSR